MFSEALKDDKNQPDGTLWSSVENSVSMASCKWFSEKKKYKEVVTCKRGKGRQDQPLVSWHAEEEMQLVMAFD